MIPAMSPAISPPRADPPAVLRSAVALRLLPDGCSVVSDCRRTYKRLPLASTVWRETSVSPFGRDLRVSDCMPPPGRSV